MKTKAKLFLCIAVVLTMTLSMCITGFAATEKVFDKGADGWSVNFVKAALSGDSWSTSMDATGWQSNVKTPVGIATKSSSAMRSNLLNGGKMIEDDGGNGGRLLEPEYRMYLKRAFTVADASKVTSLTVSVDYDDDAKIYLNGKLITTAVAPSAGYVGDNVETHNATITDLSALKNGENIIAVEVSSVGGSDIYLNMSMSYETGTASTDNTPATTNPPADNTPVATNPPASTGTSTTSSGKESSPGTSDSGIVAFAVLALGVASCTLLLKKKN